MYFNRWIALIVFVSNTLIAQNLLNGPEDIVQDTLFQRYLVANANSSNIVQIDYNGNHSVFKYGVSVPLGLQIQDSILFVTTNYPTVVKGYRLDNGSLVHNISISSATALAGICNDDNGFLYVVDQAGKIYKVNPETGTFDTFVNSGLTQGTQGICYDPGNQRLIVVSYPNNSPIRAVNLLDSTVTTVTTTTIGVFLKIISDSNSNFYVSSWRTNSVYKFNSDFSNPPETFSNNHHQPTGMCINEQQNSMYIVNFASNTIDTVSFNPNLVNEENTIELKDYGLCQNYPNPFNPTTTIKYSIAGKKYVQLDIFNGSGIKIKTLIKNFQNRGDKSIVWDSTNDSGHYVASGVYYYRLVVDDYSITKKMLLIR